jgi:hypothetical protein
MFNQLKLIINTKFSQFSKPKLFALFFVSLTAVFLVIKFIVSKLSSDNQDLSEDVKIINIDNQSEKKDNSSDELSTQKIDVANPDGEYTNQEQQNIVSKNETQTQEQNNPNKSLNNQASTKQTNIGSDVQKTQEPNESKNNQNLQHQNDAKKTNVKTQQPKMQQQSSLKQQSEIQQNRNDETIETTNKPESFTPKKEIIKKILDKRIQDSLKNKGIDKTKASYNGSNVVSKNGKYKLQIVAYSNSLQSRSLATKLKKNKVFHGKKFFINQKKVKNKVFYVVQVGVFSSKSNAIEFCNKIKKQHIVNSCFLVAE